MRRSVLLLLTLVVLLILPLSAAHAKGLDFDLINKTGKPITQLYISPTNVDDWEENLLEGDEPLADGETLTINFDSNEKAEQWDIKAVYADGSSHVWKNFNLRQIASLTLNQNSNFVISRPKS